MVLSQFRKMGFGNKKNSVFDTPLWHSMGWVVMHLFSLLPTITLAKADINSLNRVAAHTCNRSS
jgi:hypothetical protein